MKAFIDTTEQEIPRPKNKRRRRNYYSGKKKRHTVKTQIMVNKKGMILHKTKHRNGTQHDYDMFKKTGPPNIPPDVEVGVDRGFQGIEKDYPHLKVKIKESERYSFPSKHSKERERLIQLLKKHGKWNDVVQLDTSALNKIIQEKQWDSDLLEVLEEYVKLERSRRLYLSKITDSSK